MNAQKTRRGFLADVGRGVLIASLGPQVAHELGLARALGDAPAASLSFGTLEPLVCLMQETPAPKLLGVLTEKLRAGAELRQLVAAGALANARTFGGEDYVGFHTFMALAPAFYMSRELPTESQALPVLKVLYRNTARIQERGGRRDEVLRQVSPDAPAEGRPAAEVLREFVRGRDVGRAERTLASRTQRSVEDAFNELLWTVQDNTEVHRVVLPYRAWDLLGLIGMEQAETFLRLSIRYCVKAESWPRTYASDEPRVLLPRLLEEHHLNGRKPGDRAVDDAWVEQLSETVFKSSPADAAGAVAAALAEGIDPNAVGEALSLAANQLLLRDLGRPPREESPGKPIGSVHGDSIGLHACDSANAWRNLARVGNARNTIASLILGAYQVSVDRTQRGGDFLHWQPLPLARHVTEIQSRDAAVLLRDLEEAIRGNLQARASALVQRYGELGHAPRAVFDLLLRYAVSEDGSLHAEKFYRTVSEEFATTRAAFRWRHLVSLARVTASEYGRPAAGVAEARALLGLT